MVKPPSASITVRRIVLRFEECQSKTRCAINRPDVRAAYMPNGDTRSLASGCVPSTSCKSGLFLVLIQHAVQPSFQAHINSFTSTDFFSPALHWPIIGLSLQSLVARGTHRSNIYLIFPRISSAPGWSSVAARALSLGPPSPS